jgi:putative ABC transport system permease protein
LSDRVPLLARDLCNGINIQGATAERVRGTCSPVAHVSPGYFDAMGTRVEGNKPTWEGMRAGDGAIVVSKAFAAHHWPDESPIGKGINAGGPKSTAWYRVVGVAEDIRSSAGVTSSPLEIVYFPTRALAGAPLWSYVLYPSLVVKVDAGDPMTLIAPITRIVAELDPQAAVSNPRTMETVLARSMAKQSFTMVLLLIAASIAMILSAVGIYGVISYVVAQRRGEIGVRVALGADVRGITTMVLRQAMGTAMLGVGIGIIAAIGTTRFLQALLFGVSPNDTMTLAIVPFVLLGVAALASYAPARRAARIDPASALRSE